MAEWETILERAELEPVGIDISDYSDEFCQGFLAGQRSILEEVAAGRLVLPAPVSPSSSPGETE